jgi:hypothetical protein
MLRSIISELNTAGLFLHIYNDATKQARTLASTHDKRLASNAIAMHCVTIGCEQRSSCSLRAEYCLLRFCGSIGESEQAECQALQRGSLRNFFGGLTLLKSDFIRKAFFG